MNATEVPVNELSLREAAEQLGVHYMTAYRHVRTGRLPAHKVGAEWRVRASDVAVALTPVPVAAPGVPRRGAFRSRLEARLVAGDEAGAWAVVEAAMAAGCEPADVMLTVVGPAMAAIGERWATGELSIADEHQASTVAARLLARLGPRFARRGRKRGVVVLGAVAGEHHQIPIAMAADIVRGAGYDVVDLGADTPPESFVDAVAARDRLVAVALSVTAAENLAAVAPTVAALHRARPGLAVILGGGAVPDAPLALSYGADAWAVDAPGLVSVLDGLTPARDV